MMRPVFARGKALERALTQAAAAASNQFAIDAPGDFTAGDAIFVGEADGSEVEFAGHVRIVGASSLTTTLHVRAAKPEGGLLWKAAESFLLPCAPDLPLRREFATGIAVERSVGGRIFSTRVAEPGRVDRLSFKGLALREARAALQWLEIDLDDGLLDFTYVDERGCALRARLLSPAAMEEQPDALTAGLELVLAVIAEGEFA